MVIKKDLSSNYKKCLKYLKQIKKFVYIILIVFFISTLFGILVPAPLQIQEAIAKFIQEIIEKTKYMSQAELIGFIFFNNVQSAFFGMILGIFFGFFSIFATIFNGYLLGYVSSLAIKSDGLLSLWRIFPHGIFELPAIFISLAMGLELGMFIFKKNKKKYLKKCLSNSIRVFIFIVIPLLVIAAIIEGTLIFLVK